MRDEAAAALATAPPAALGAAVSAAIDVAPDEPLRKLVLDLLAADAAKGRAARRDGAARDDDWAAAVRGGEAVDDLRVAKAAAAEAVARCDGPLLKRTVRNVLAGVPLDALVARGVAAIEKADPETLQGAVLASLDAAERRASDFGTVRARRERDDAARARALSESL